MKPWKRSFLTATAAIVFTSSLAAAGQHTSPFAPLQEWKAAVASGDQAALAKLYSANPPAQVQVGKEKAELAGELRYWAGLKSDGVTGLNPKVLETSTSAGQTRVLLRIQALKDGNQPLVASMVQLWAQQPDGWRLVASRRSEFSNEQVRRLPQPAVPNTDLYAPPQEAEAELHAALGQAAKEHKRVIVVFGANWCYDCHVLDTTFRSAEFAPLVNANYVVVHINIGDEGKDNHELADRLGVALDKGIPSLAVLEADGKVVMSQRAGEFESTVKIGPEDVRAFLEKWKPARG